MDSQLALLERLIQEGSEFTPQTFCYPNEHGGEFCGDDTSEWKAWKTRSCNLALKQACSDADLTRVHPRTATATVVRSGNRPAAGLSSKL